MMRILLMLSLVFQVAVGQEVQEYEVKGSVAKPGKVKWEKGVTLAGAIEAAGGLKDDAVVSRVTLIRNEKSYVYNFRNEAHQGIRIYARDVIEVKRSGAIRSGQALHIRITGVEKIDQARLDATYSVDPKGMLTMWKIGKVKAQGKTNAELVKELSAAYKKAGIFENAVFHIFEDDGGDVEFIGITVGGR
jgi:protein involved in polysaccharide export with SLBB domain